MAAFAPIDPNELAQFHQLITSSAPAQKKKPGNFLTHLIPSIGGTGGAIGGAAAGTAIAPGVGTLLGALLGGAIGGGGAKVGENAIEHQKLNSGVTGQAVEQGVLGAGPLRLAKFGTIGAKAGIDAAVAGKGLTGALSAAGEKATTPLIKTQLAKTGTALQGEARGIKPGVTQTGTSGRLKPAQADELNQYLDTLGAKNSAHTQVRAVEQDLKQSGKQIGGLVAQHNRTLSSPELALIKEAADKAASKTINLNAKDAALKDVQTQIKKATDLSSLKGVRDNLDDHLKSFYSKGERNTTTTPAVEKVLKGYRDGINKVLQDGVPGFKDVNTRYKLGLKAQDQLLKSANPSGLRFFGIQTGVGGEGLQASKDLTGRTLKKVAGRESTAAVPGLSAGSIASRTLPVGGLQALASTAPTAQQGSDTTDQSQGSDLTSALMSAQGGDGTDQQATSGSPYSQENLMADIQRDPKHASDYISTFKELDSIFNPSDSSDKLNSTQQQQAFNAQSGLDSLNEIASILQKNPNAAKESSLPGGSLTAHLTGTGTYQAAVNNAIDVIGRLRSGGAIGQEEEKNFKRLLPAFGDDQQTTTFKLQQLASVFQNFANPKSAQPNSNDLASALMQAGGTQ